MAFEHKANSGMLFVNEEKHNEKSPDSSGSALVGGVEYRIAAWRHAPAEGKKGYLSIAFTPKDEEKSGGGRPAQRPSREDMDDEIPF